jgi:ABC-type transport system involved in multi-copper enzyme maturation permease subunit
MKDYISSIQRMKLINSKYIFKWENIIIYFFIIFFISLIFLLTIGVN